MLRFCWAGLLSPEIMFTQALATFSVLADNYWAPENLSVEKITELVINFSGASTKLPEISSIFRRNFKLQEISSISSISRSCRHPALRNCSLTHSLQRQANRLRGPFVTVKIGRYSHKLLVMVNNWAPSPTMGQAFSPPGPTRIGNKQTVRDCNVSGGAAKSPSSRSTTWAPPPTMGQAFSPAAGAGRPTRSGNK